MDEGAAAKFACVKAMGTLNADARELYKLFLDNERVHVSAGKKNGTCMYVPSILGTRR